MIEIPFANIYLDVTFLCKARNEFTKQKLVLDYEKGTTSTWKFTTNSLKLQNL